jgi:hypothetical protein
LIISKRRKKSLLTTKVTRRISEIPARDWNGVFPKTMEGYDLFKTMDDAGSDQFSLYYVIAYENRVPVGACSCFIMKYPMDTGISGPLKRVTNAIKKIAPGLLSLKALICGSPIGQGRIGISGVRPDVMNALLGRIEQMSRKNKAAIIAFKDFSEEYTNILDPLVKKGYSKLSSLPNAEMKLDFNDFEGYLSTLSSESRYGLRRKFKKVDGRVKIDLDIIDSVSEEMLKDIYKLYLDVNIKHGMGFELMPIEFFRDISRNMPGSAKFFLWKMDGNLVKFLLCLASEDIFIDYYVGFDYSVAHKYNLYFIGFRDTINWCIKNKIKNYEIGVTGYETKRRLGFDFKPRYIYVKPRLRVLAPVFKLLCQFLKFENFDPDLKKLQLQ